MKEDICRILDRPYTKVVLNSFLSVASGVFLGLLTGFIVSGKNAVLWGILFGVTVLGSIGLTIYYTKTEISDRDQIKKYKSQVEDYETSLKAYDSVIQGISYLCKTCATEVNVQIHDIIDTSKLDLNKWNYDLASAFICSTIYDHILKECCSQNSVRGMLDIEVSVVRIQESSDHSKLFAVLSAYYNPTMRKPTIYQTRRPINNSNPNKTYYDIKLISDGLSDPRILLDETEIRDCFCLKKPHNYSQYIAVPVLCQDIKQEEKIIGLIEIACKNGCKISNDRETIKNYIDRFITPYAQLLLLFYKLEKALRATPAK